MTPQALYRWLYSTDPILAAKDKSEHPTHGLPELSIPKQS